MNKKKTNVMMFKKRSILTNYRYALVFGLTDLSHTMQHLSKNEYSDKEKNKMEIKFKENDSPL